jgi:hypothetical protein
MAELALELLNLMAALCILYCVVRLTPTLNLRLQRRAVQLLLLATTTFFINEVLGVLGVFWVSEGLAVLRDGLEMTFIFSLAIALLLRHRAAMHLPRYGRRYCERYRLAQIPANCCQLSDTARHYRLCAKCQMAVERGKMIS